MKLSFFYRLKTPSYLFEFCQEIVLSKNVIISCIQKKTWHARNISFSQHYSRIAPSLFISYALVINLYNVEQCTKNEKNSTIRNWWISNTSNTNRQNFMK